MSMLGEGKRKAYGVRRERAAMNTAVVVSLLPPAVAVALVLPAAHRRAPHDAVHRRGRGRGAEHPDDSRRAAPASGRLTGRNVRPPHLRSRHPPRNKHAGLIFLRGRVRLAGMAAVEDVLTDLTAEGAELEDLVAGCDDWSAQTPAAGWTIAHQIGHLAWTDHVSHLAAADAGGFAALLERASADPLGFVDDAAEQWSTRDDLRPAWRVGRGALVDALAAAPPDVKLPWFGPPMSPTSMATARLMETWAHGQDVADALGLAREPTDRIRHVAHIGAHTRDFAFTIRELTPPADPFRIELTAPSGALWTWGPDDAVQRVSGPALDFCLRVTQRRHRDDLGLVAEGADADRWLDIAQAFAGPPGPGRPKSGAA
jgi:uncharacterized protein (TIGR03084 family)